MAKQIPISREFAKETGRELMDLLDADIRQRQPMLAKIELIRAYYYGDVKRKLRYPGQVNMHLPVIAEKVEGLVPKMMNALFGADPHVILQRVGNDPDPDRTLLNEAFLNWTIEVDIPETYRRIQRWVRSSFLDGPSVIMPYYCYKTRKGVVTQNMKTYWREGDTDLMGMTVPADRIKLPVELLAEYFGPSVNIKELKRGKEDYADGAETQQFEGIEAVVDFVENRQRHTDVPVYFYDTKYVDEVELCIHKDIVVSDHVRLDNLEFEDIIVPYHAQDLQEAERVGRQYWLTVADIEDRRANEGWDLDDEDMAVIRGQARAEKKEVRVDNDQLKEQLDEQIGVQDDEVSPSRHFKPFTDNKVLVFEVYTQDDADGDGKLEEVIYQIPACLERIVRADYLEAIFPHQRRPFAVLHGVQCSNTYYSIPISQWLLPINEEVDVIINQVHEAQEVINNPFFFYEPLALSDAAELLNGLYPGLGVRTANAQGINIPSFPQQPLANLSAVDSLLMFADRLTMSPQSVGSSQVRNAPRTARGTMALLSEAGAKVDTFIMEAQKNGWRDLMYQIHGLYSHYGPEEKWFWVTGEMKPRKIMKSDMDGRFEYIFSGNSVNTNREVRRSISQLRYATLANEPLYMQDMTARQALIEDFLRHNSEGVNIHGPIKPRIQGQGGTHAPMDQGVELELMRGGRIVEVLMTDDDAAHLDVIRKYMASSAFEMLESWQIALVAQHADAHAKQLMNKNMQGQLPGGAAGSMGNNVPQEMSDLEGGVV